MRALAVLGLVISLLAPPAVAQVPQVISHEGRMLRANGTPEVGLVQLTFRLYTSATGGAAVWTEPRTVTLSAGGFYAVQLGSSVALPELSGSAYWLGITVEGEAEMLPRAQLASVPFALRAAQADDVRGVKNVYTVWGRETCGADPLIHQGYAGGFGGDQGAMGGMAMCLDKDAHPANWNAWTAALVSRARSTTQTGGNRSEYMQIGDMKCAVCKGSGYTLWGRTTCDPQGRDAVVYTGYIAHFNYNTTSGGYANAGPFCADDSAPGQTWTNWGGNSILARGAGANSSPYAQYLDGRDGRCVVCR